MLRHIRSRRRPRYGAHLCVLIATVLLLLSVSLLYSRLSFFSSYSQHRPLQVDSTYGQLLDDLDNDFLITSNSNEDRIDEFDDAATDNAVTNEEILTEEDDDDDAQHNQNPSTSTSSYFFDPLNGAVRRSYNKRSIEEWEDYVPFNLKLASDLGFDTEKSKPAFGSDDILVDEKLRRMLSEVRTLNDALLLKGSVLREGWGDWFDKKGDFLRRDRMFKSNIEVLNPLNNPFLQDPDAAGVTTLTKGDKIFEKGVLNKLKRTPFLIKKPLPALEQKNINAIQADKSDGIENKRVDRTLNNAHTTKLNSPEVYADGKRWGYYPGLDGKLSFGNFMDAFFRKEKCKMRVFMVWNSPAWMFGVRQQRVLESLLYHHPDACVVVFSETIELNFFKEFVQNGYHVAVVMPNLDELLKDTPVHIFASVWYEWKETKYYPTHFSELIRLAALFKYGGIYLDSDILVLKNLSELNNTVALENELDGKWLSGAVMAFRKHSPFILDCLSEFYASYDDSLLRWNGADLLTRVANNFSSHRDAFELKKELQLQPSFIISPVNQTSISRYFSAPTTKEEQFDQDSLFNTIMDKAITFHFWNRLTFSQLPEAGSLVFRLLNRFCIRCSDTL